MRIMGSSRRIQFVSLILTDHIQIYVQNNGVKGERKIVDQSLCSLQAHLLRIQRSKFAALDAEEMGLQGAKALVNDFPFPLNTVILNINLDMISKNQRNELYAAGTAHYPHLRPLLEEASKDAPIKLLFGHDIPGTDMQDWTSASDHAAFHEQGIPFIYFGVEDHEDYHKAT